MTAIPGDGASRPGAVSPTRDGRFLTFISGTAAADVGDQAWIVVLAYAAASTGDPLMATITVAAGTVPRAILDLVGGVIADRFPTRPVLVSAAIGRVLVLALGLCALATTSGWTIPIVVAVAICFGAADAVHKPAVATMPRQLVPIGQLVRAAGLRQLVARMALLGGPALAGLVLAGVGLDGAFVSLLALFVLAAILLAWVRPRLRREVAERQSVVSSTRQVLGYLRRDRPARALILFMVGLNFFVIPIINAGVALRVNEEGWGARVLGVLMASIGVGAVLGALISLRLRPKYPMRLAVILLVVQGIALATVGIAPMVGIGAALLVVGLTAGLASPMLAGSMQATVRQAYLGRVYALHGLADDALVPFALLGYGLVASSIGIRPTTVICGAGMAVLMASGLLRPSLRNLRILDREDGTTGIDGRSNQDGATRAADPEPGGTKFPEAAKFESGNRSQEATG